MSAGKMSDGSPVTPELDARMLADLREWRRRYPVAQLHAVTGDELDMLLRAAAERDALKREACAMPDEREANEARAAVEPAMRTPGTCSRCGGRIYYSRPSHAWVHAGAVPEGCVPRPKPTRVEIPAGHALIKGEIVPLPPAPSVMHIAGEGGVLCGADRVSRTAFGRRYADCPTCIAVFDDRRHTCRHCWTRIKSTPAVGVFEHVASASVVGLHPAEPIA